ncbi:MAG: [Fe-Fe] hydrogenase large subunit C-terminal domain-containing protein [Salinivirgaceae bacterium]
MRLSRIITVDKNKCVNCHQCIAACSTKYANNGFGDTVEVNDNLCIGCGECIKACSHEARIPVDDFEAAMIAIQNKEKVIALVAPAIATNFPQKYLNINGWLKTIGVSALFDVSFGAELTIKSYLNHITSNKPKTVISQPCPAIVTYIEVYKPELLPFLAPADSPMMHTIKMIREFYPKYNDHKIIIVSPCLAKKREFEEVGAGDYNVTMNSLENYIEQQNVDLKKYPEVGFDNDSAERAVLFSTPGGLLSTAERDFRPIRNVTRKIEGPHTIYPYLDSLYEQIELGRAPLLIDCLNCEKGCNGGTGTTKKDSAVDELEFHINERRKHQQERYKTDNEAVESITSLQTIISKYWKKGLYDRDYINRSELFTTSIKIPSEQQFDSIYKEMHKYSEKDIINCSSCGYNSCEMMATAIHNNLNKPENCHFYMSHINQEKAEELNQHNLKLHEQKMELIEQSENLLLSIEKIRNFTK